MNSTTRLFRNLAFGLTALITASLIVATAVEGVAGSGKAHSSVYDAAWMTALWTFAAVAALVYLWLRRHTLKFATAMFHIALLIILAGAAITRSQFTKRQNHTYGGGSAATIGCRRVG